MRVQVHSNIVSLLILFTFIFTTIHTGSHASPVPPRRFTVVHVRRIAQEQNIPLISVVVQDAATTSVPSSMTATGTPTATETRKNEATSSIDARPSPTETGDVTTGGIHIGFPGLMRPLTKCLPFRSISEARLLWRSPAQAQDYTCEHHSRYFYDYTRFPLLWGWSQG